MVSESTECHFSFRNAEFEEEEEFSEKHLLMSYFTVPFFKCSKQQIKIRRCIVLESFPLHVSK